MDRAEKIVVDLVGVGAAEGWVTAHGEELIAAADVVAGFATVLAPVQTLIRGDTFVLTYANQEAELAQFADRVRGGARGVVCAWGDPNLSSGELQARVIAALPEATLQIVPGISSVQLAMARLHLPMERVWITTLHRRAEVNSALDELLAVRRTAQRTGLILIGPWEWMPPRIAATLQERGLKSQARLVTLERLGHAEERIRCWMARELTAARADDFSDLTVLALEPPGDNL